MPRAAIDVGSNSVKLVLADDLATPLLDRVAVTGLGEGLGRTGRLAEPAMARTLDALAALVAEARARGAGDFAAVGTAALRAAANADEFCARARARCGIAIAVIPGEEEARLAFLAARSGAGAPAGPCLVVDIGGGSTEFIFGKGKGEGDAMGERFSLPLGCLRATEEFQRSDPAPPAVLAAMATAFAAALAPLAPGAGALIGIGGTFSSLGTVALGAPDWDPRRVEGLELSRAEVERQLALYQRLRIAERAALPGLMPERAPVILAGAAIALAVMRRRGAERLRLSSRALRHGLWLARWGRSA
ncbi:Ppx/GppA family phosphatase [bacterium]|nr:Ppx/GppA family phosphatase [bacterium]